MKSFRQYLEENQDDQGNQDGNQVDTPGLGDMNYGQTENNVGASLLKIIKLAWERNQADTQAFFERLATNDSDIREELVKLDPSKKAKNAAGQQQSDNDDVVSPPESDGNSGSETEDGEVY